MEKLDIKINTLYYGVLTLKKSYDKDTICYTIFFIKSSFFLSSLIHIVYISDIINKRSCIIKIPIESRVAKLIYFKEYESNR